jgi:hypothetical protein
MAQNAPTDNEPSMMENRPENITENKKPKRKRLGRTNPRYADKPN